jgi:hypothetical protein
MGEAGIMIMMRRREKMISAIRKRGPSKRRLTSDGRERLGLGTTEDVQWNEIYARLGGW